MPLCPVGEAMPGDGGTWPCPGPPSYPLLAASAGLCRDGLPRDQRSSSGPKDQPLPAGLPKAGAAHPRHAPCHVDPPGHAAPTSCGRGEGVSPILRHPSGCPAPTQSAGVVGGAVGPARTRAPWAAHTGQRMGRRPPWRRRAPREPQPRETKAKTRLRRQVCQQSSPAAWGRRSIFSGEGPCPAVTSAASVCPERPPAASSPARSVSTVTVRVTRGSPPFSPAGYSVTSTISVTMVSVTSVTSVTSRVVTGFQDQALRGALARGGVQAAPPACPCPFSGTQAVLPFCTATSDRLRFSTGLPGRLRPALGTGLQPFSTGAGGFSSGPGQASAMLLPGDCPASSPRSRSCGSRRSSSDCRLFSPRQLGRLTEFPMAQARAPGPRLKSRPETSQEDARYRSHRKAARRPDPVLHPGAPSPTPAPSCASALGSCRCCPNSCTGFGGSQPCPPPHPEQRAAESRGPGDRRWPSPRAKWREGTPRDPWLCHPSSGSVWGAGPCTAGARLRNRHVNDGYREAAQGAQQTGRCSRPASLCAIRLTRRPAEPGEKSHLSAGPDKGGPGICWGERGWGPSIWEHPPSRQAGRPAGSPPCRSHKSPTPPGRTLPRQRPARAPPQPHRCLRPDPPLPAP